MTTSACTMTPSDWIEILGILASVITSIIAIIISVKTLQQNNKMIEESTRPVLTIYSKYVDDHLYIILKNLGNSPCIVDSIQTDLNITNEEKQPFTGNPYENISGATIPPKKSIICTLIPYSLKKRNFKFVLKYHSQSKSYTDECEVNCDADNIFPDLYPTIDPKNHGDIIALKTIAHAIQNIHKQNL